MVRLTTLAVVLATIVTVLAMPGTAGAAPGVLDQSQALSEGNGEAFYGSGGPLPGGQIIAQTFTAGISGNLDQVDLLLARGSLGGSAGDAIVQIQSVSAGTPSGTILASIVLPEASVTLGVFAPISVTVSPAVPVSAGTSYAIVLLAPNAVSPSNSYGTLDASANPYAGGMEFSSHDGGATWNPIISAASPDGYDMTFKTYVAPTVVDADGDGIPDPSDACPSSDLDPTVVIDGRNTHAGNDLGPHGCTVQDLIDKAAATARTHGQFVVSVAGLVAKLRHDGVLTLREAVAILVAAAKADIP